MALLLGITIGDAIVNGWRGSLARWLRGGGGCLSSRLRFCLLVRIYGLVTWLGSGAGHRGDGGGGGAGGVVDLSKAVDLLDRVLSVFGGWFGSIVGEAHRGRGQLLVPLEPLQPLFLRDGNDWFIGICQGS